jgi:hypothetical protein
MRVKIFFLILGLFCNMTQAINAKTRGIDIINSLIHNRKFFKIREIMHLYLEHSKLKDLFEDPNSATFETFRVMNDISYEKVFVSKTALYFAIEERTITSQLKPTRIMEINESGDLNLYRIRNSPLDERAYSPRKIQVLDQNLLD